MIGTLISLASGALGGNLAGALMKNSSMGTLWNSIAGIAGGGLGAGVLSMIPGMEGVASEAASSGLSASSILSSVAGGGVGGGIVMAVIGMIRKAMAK